LEQQAERLGIRSDVVFVPAQQDVASWLRSMDIFVLASESEAFSNALLEALACGCAPIGSSVGGTPEQIVDGERGFIFPSQDVAALADKLKRLILDDGLRKSFGLRSAEFARTELSMGRACERMGGLYRSLIEQAASRAA
jgi:glycosyltransferase involved in cell wall biosynthesis